MIESEFQNNTAMVISIDQDKKKPVDSLMKEFEIIWMGILNTSSLEQWSEDMDSANTPVILLLNDIIKSLELSMVASGGIHTAGTTYMSALENKW